MGNVTSLNKEKKFNKEGELFKRIENLIREYDGEISLVSALGILELHKHKLIREGEGEA